MSSQGSRNGFPGLLFTKIGVIVKLVRMRMKMKISGTRNGVEWPDVGETIDLPLDEAEQYRKHGYCEVAKDENDKPVVTEVKPEPKK